MSFASLRCGANHKVTALFSSLLCSESLDHVRAGADPLASDSGLRVGINCSNGSEYARRSLKEGLLAGRLFSLARDLDRLNTSLGHSPKTGGDLLHVPT